MNTVGPYDNRQETYAYYSLPFCQGTKQSIGHYHETLSEALQGVELEHSGYAIDFRGKVIFNSKMTAFPHVFNRIHISCTSICCCCCCCCNYCFLIKQRIHQKPKFV